LNSCLFFGSYKGDGNNVARKQKQLIAVFYDLIPVDGFQHTRKSGFIYPLAEHFGRVELIRMETDDRTVSGIFPGNVVATVVPGYFIRIYKVQVRLLNLKKLFHI